MGDRKHRRAWWALAAVTLLALVMAATPAFNSVLAAAPSANAPTTPFPNSGLLPSTSPSSCAVLAGSAYASGNTAAVSPSLATTAGNTVTVFAETFNSGDTQPTVTGSTDGTYTLADSGAANLGYMDYVYYATAMATGCDAITVHTSIGGLFVTAVDMGPTGSYAHSTFSYSAYNIAVATSSGGFAAALLIGHGSSASVNCTSPSGVVNVNPGLPDSGIYTGQCMFSPTTYSTTTFAYDLSSGDAAAISFAAYVPPAIAAPQGISITHITTTSAELNWSQNVSAVNDTPQLYSGTGCTGIPTAFSTGSAVNDYVFTSLMNAAWYSADVIAWNSYGASVPSACIDWQSGSAVWWSEIVYAETLVVTHATWLNLTINYTAVEGDTITVNCVAGGSMTVLYDCGDTVFAPQSTWSSGIIGYVAATCGALTPNCEYEGVLTFSGAAQVYFSNAPSDPLRSPYNSGVLSVFLVETPPSTWWANENPAQNDTFGDNYTAAYGSTVTTISAGSDNNMYGPNYTLPFANMLVISEVNSNLSGTFISDVQHGASLGVTAEMNVFANITTKPQLYTSTATKTTGTTPDWLQLTLLPMYWPTSMPTEFTVLNVAFTAANVSWLQPVTGPSANIDNNTLFLFSGSGCVGTAVQLSTGSYATTYDFTGLADNTPYSAYVTAWNATGQSPPSNCADFMTLLTVDPSLVVSGVSFTSFIETWGNGTWTNITAGFGVFLVFGETAASLAVAEADALSPDTGGRLGVWTWTTYVRDAPVQIGNGSTVLYNYNVTVNSNTTFASSYAIWVALVMVDGSSYFVFSIQLVTFGIALPPPTSGCPLICILIVALVTVPLAGTYLFFAINKRWPWQFHEYKVRRNPFWGRRGRL